MTCLTDHRLCQTWSPCEVRGSLGHRSSPQHRPADGVPVASWAGTSELLKRYTRPNLSIQNINSLVRTILSLIIRERFNEATRDTISTVSHI
jgi:hypothetical protein